MSYEKRFPDWEQQVKNASAITASASAAAAFLGVKYATYKKYAEKYGCYITNQSGKGETKSRPSIPLSEILEGLHPQYSTHKLRLRLLSEGGFTHKCSNCGLTEWLGSSIPLELEHKDGKCNNHVLSNLELLCPNCHAFTETYRGKNKGLNSS